MSYSDFDVIIGADTSQAERDLQSIGKLVDEIGNNYPLKVKAVLTNKEELIGDIQDIINMFKTMDKFSIDVFGDSDGSKIKKSAEEVSKSMSSITRESEETARNMKDAFKAFEDLQQVRQKIDTKNMERSTITEKSGNDFVSTTKTYTLSELEKSGQLAQPKIEEIVTDFKSLDKYIENINKKMSEWKHVTEVMPNDVAKLEAYLESIREEMANDPMAFKESISDVKMLETSLNSLEQQMVEREKSFDRLRNKFKSADVSMARVSDVERQENDLELIRKSVKDLSVTPNDFAKMTEEWLDNQINLVQQHKHYTDQSKELDKLLKSINNTTEKWRQEGLLDSSEIDEFESKLQGLDVRNFGFDDTMNEIKNNFTELGQRHEQLVEQQTVSSRIDQEKLKWQKRINSLELEGYTHYKQMEALKKRMSQLDASEIEDTEQLNALLKEMNNQYARAVEYQQKTKFGVRQRDKSEDWQSKVETNIDPNLVRTEDFDEIQRNINKIFDTSNSQELEEAVRRINKLYKELLEQQSEAIQQQKDLQALHDHLADMEKKTIDEQTRIANEENEMKAQIYEDRLKRNEQFSNEISKRNYKEIQETLKQAKKEGEAYNAEQDRLYLNQQKINEEFKEYDKIIDNLRESEFFDESDLNKFREMIDNISSESQTLERDLKNVRKELENINSELNKRRAKQEDADLLNMSNQLKADKLMANDILPEHLINNFRELSDSLSFESSKQDVAELNAEYKKLVALEEELKKHNKESEAYKKLVLQAEQELVRVTDRYSKNIDEISYLSQRDLQDTSRQTEMLARVADVQNRINDVKERGWKLSRSENNEIQESITLLRRRLQELKKEEQQQISQLRRTQQLQDRFDSIEYRAKRGLDRHPQMVREISAEAQKIQQRLQGISNLTGEEFEREFRQIEDMMTGLNRLSRGYRDEAISIRNSVFGRLQHAMKQVPVWISAMGVFYGAIRQVRQGFQSLLEIDKAMTNLSKVTEATTTQLENFKGVASEIGYELGALIEDVIDATTEFQKLGYTLQESAVLGRNTLIYANVGDMSVEDATKGIISTIKGFNIEIDKAGANVTKVVDVFNEIGNNFAISSAGIGEALQRSSAVLYEAGNTLEQSVAIVASANANIQDPKRVGNALKTIAMRLRGVSDEGKTIAGLLPQLEETFQSIGITMMEDEDTFKSTYQIMDELAKKWGELTDIQRANLVELIGGKRQGTVVSAMLNNWSDAVNAYESGLNSAGSAQREITKYMDSFEYKINQLKVSMENFWMTVIDDEAVKKFIENLTAMIQALTKFVEEVGALPVLLNVGAMFGFLVSRGLRDRVFGDLKKMREEMTLTADVTTKKSQKMARGIKNAGRIAGSFALRMFGVGLAITAVSKAIEVAYNWFTKEKRQREERLRYLDDEITKYQNLKANIESIDFNRYYELEKRMNTTGLNSDELYEYNSIQTQIKDNLPELISHYDEHNNAVIRDADAIRELVDAKEELYQQNKKEQYDLQLEEADFEDLDKRIDEYQMALKDSANTQIMEEAYSFAEEFFRNEIQGLEVGSKEYLDKVKELRQGFVDIMSETSGYFGVGFANIEQQNFNDMLASVETNGLDSFISYIQDRKTELGLAMSDLSVTVDTARADIGANVQEFKVMLDDAFEVALFDRDISVQSNEFLFIQRIKEQILQDIGDLSEEGATALLEQVPSMIDEALEELRNTDINLNKLLNSTSIDVAEIERNYDIAIASIDENNRFANILIETLKRLKEQHLDTARSMRENADYGFSFEEDIIPILNNYTDSISRLDSAYNSLNEGQALSIQQIFDLISNYPELSKQLEIHNGQIRLSQEAIMDLAKIKEKEFKRDLEIKKQQAKAAQDKAKAVISSILQEVKAHDLLSQAMSKGMQKTSAMLNEEINRYGHLIRMAEKEGQPRSVINRLIEEQNRARDEKSLLMTNIGEYISLQEEIDKINALLNFDFSSNLGSIGSIGSGKSKAKESIQDAIYVADLFQQAMDKLNHKIAMQQKLQERYPQHSRKFQDSLKEELRLTREKRAEIDKEIESLKKQIEQGEIQEKGLITLGKEGNKTARARQAEIRQAIDEAKKELMSLEEESADAWNRIKELRYALIESNIEAYRNRREELDDDIAYADYAMTLYDKESQAYSNMANTKLKHLKELQKYHEQEVAYLELELKQNDMLTEAQKENLRDLISEARQAVYSVNQSIQDLQTEIAEISFNKVIKGFVDEIDEYSDAIEEIRDKLQYDVADDDYSSQMKYLRDILSLTKGQTNDIKNNIKELENMKREYEGNHEMVSTITAEIEKWEDELKSSEKALKDVKKEMRNLYEDLADEIVDLYKEQIELMQQADEERYNNLMESQRKAHDQRMKHLDEELKRIREIYNEQLKMIDREEATRDFTMSLEQLEKEAQSLRSRINELSLDDSFEARAKRTELEEQLTEKELEIAELKHDREVELRRNSLEDALENEEKLIEDKRDKYDEDYERFVETEEKKQEERNKYYEQALQDERKFAQLRQDIIDGNFDSMMNIIQDWSRNVSNEMGILGDIITRNFTDKVQQAINALSELSRMNIGGYNQSIRVDATDKDAPKTPTNEKRNEGSVDKSANNNGDTGGTKPTNTGSSGSSSGGNSGSSKGGSSSSGGKKTSRRKGVATGDVWLHNKANFNTNSRVRVLKKGQSVWIVGESSSGLMYKTEDGLYVSKKYISLSGVPSSSSGSSSKNKGKLTGDLYIRTGIGAEYKAIGVMKKGETVEILDHKYGWYKVNWKGKTGWAWDKYIAKLNKGGITPKFEGGKLAILHEQEMVANKVQTKDILETAKIVDNFKHILPKLDLSKISPADNSTTDNSQVINENYNINIENLNGNRKEAEIVTEQIVSRLRRTRGGRY